MVSQPTKLVIISVNKTVQSKCVSEPVDYFKKKKERKKKIFLVEIYF